MDKPYIPDTGDTHLDRTLVLLRDAWEAALEPQRRAILQDRGDAIIGALSCMEMVRDLSGPARGVYRSLVERMELARTKRKAVFLDVRPMNDDFIRDAYVMGIDLAKPDTKDIGVTWDMLKHRDFKNP